MKTRFSIKAKSVFALVLGLFALSTGCSKTGSPSIGELIKTGPVLFNGVTDIKITTTTTGYLLQGTCDPIAYGLQYSVNSQTNWVDVPGGCPANGQFSWNENVTGYLNIYARERTKNGFTTISHAFIRLLLPPTSPAYTMVASSESDNDGNGTAATQNSVNLNMTGNEMFSASNKLHMGAVSIVYGN